MVCYFSKTFNNVYFVHPNSSSAADTYGTAGAFGMASTYYMVHMIQLGNIEHVMWYQEFIIKEPLIL